MSGPDGQDSTPGPAVLGAAGLLLLATVLLALCPPADSGSFVPDDAVNLSWHSPWGRRTSCRDVKLSA